MNEEARWYCDLQGPLHRSEISSANKLLFLLLVFLFIFLVFLIFVFLVFVLAHGVLLLVKFEWVVEKS